MISYQLLYGDKKMKLKPAILIIIIILLSVTVASAWHDPHQDRHSNKKYNIDKINKYNNLDRSTSGERGYQHSTVSGSSTQPEDNS